jgi:hypothetical protein
VLHLVQGDHDVLHAGGGHADGLDVGGLGRVAQTCARGEGVPGGGGGGDWVGVNVNKS